MKKLSTCIAYHRNYEKLIKTIRSL